MKSTLLKCFLIGLSLSLVSCSGEKQEEQNQDETTTAKVTSLDLPKETKEGVKVGEDNQLESKENLPEFTFESDVFDFGKIEQGDKVDHVFTFTNTGKSPLIISNIKTTCGCTTPTWTKEPVQVGESGKIEVSFNSSGKSNKQTKPITIFSNAGEAVVVTLTGFVDANKSNGPFKKEDK